MEVWVFLSLQYFDYAFFFTSFFFIVADHVFEFFRHYADVDVMSVWLVVLAKRFLQLEVRFVTPNIDTDWTTANTSRLFWWLQVSSTSFSRFSLWRRRCGHFSRQFCSIFRVLRWRLPREVSLPYNRLKLFSIRFYFSLLKERVVYFL